MISRNSRKHSNETVFQEASYDQTMPPSSGTEAGMKEAFYPAPQYIPIADVEQSLIERTDYSTYCPYKGRASYYNIPAGGSRSENGVWTYETPYEAVAQIKDHVAFYPNGMDSIEITTN
jgi:uncharacterized protein (DUF427 family)